MATVGLCPHPERDVAAALAKETSEWLQERGHRAVFLAADSWRDPSMGALNLAVSLGGDGTMLWTLGMVGRFGVPVLGVHLGRLGFLTPVEPEGLRPALERFLEGDYLLEPRMTLDISLSGGSGEPELLGQSALNDVVVERQGGGHTVHALVRLRGRPFVSYAADSLIVATPTGSTAYNLSARGPIVSPQAQVIVLTPVAPHSFFDRSIVLDAADSLTLEIVDDRSADLVVDGRAVAVLDPGQLLHCSRGRRDALLVTFSE
ncbi:MAG: NAD(+)/NADH kinase, partial [Acidimicrobiales bacterium]